MGMCKKIVGLPFSSDFGTIFLPPLFPLLAFHLLTCNITMTWKSDRSSHISSLEAKSVPRRKKAAYERAEGG